MSGARRIVAAAIAGWAAAGLLAVAIASDAPAGRTAATLVTLEVAPRGPGVVSASPAGVDLDNNNAPVKQPCAENDGQNLCRWGFPRGTSVKLSASVQAGGKSLAGWSTPDCPGSGPCTVTLDQDVTTIVATFNPLTLGIKLSSDDEGRVTSDPAWIDCSSQDDAKCQAAFAPHTQVKLTATPKGSNTFRAWGATCQPANQRTCTISVDDQTTWASVAWNNDGLPGTPTTINVEFQLRKGGNGSGQITGSGLDCGSKCSAKFGFGKSITVTAKPDQGSTFDGWNGVCSKTQASCSFAAGPITTLKASFAKDTTPPSTPTGLTVTDATLTSIDLKWTASTDNVGVAGYRVYLDDASAGDTTQTTFTLSKLACSHTYAIAVDAADAVGNRSGKATLTAQTKPCPLASRLAGAGVVTSGGARTVKLQLRVNRATVATVTLTAGRKTLTAARFRVV